MGNHKECEVLLLKDTGISPGQLCFVGKTLEIATSLEKHLFNSVYEGQHLYILSDEEIKDGDYGFVTCAIISYNTMIKEFGQPLGKKIIATTNSNLKIELSHNPTSNQVKDLFTDLPRIPQQFIEDYIKGYNDGTPIAKVIVEYESGKSFWERSDGLKHYGDNGSFDGEIVEKIGGIWTFRKDPLQLKINADNTISIKPVKVNWNIEDVKFIATRFAHECRLRGVVTNKDTCELFDEWFGNIQYTWAGK